MIWFGKILHWSFNIGVIGFVGCILLGLFSIKVPLYIGCLTVFMAIIPKACWNFGWVEDPFD